ncbi:MAG: hypothetical protein HFH43_05725 [Lachnospiraceae bacterium]|nr:hypothetical protein [Lachnospiraceae bacterium]
MAGIVLRKIGVVLLTILKWILQTALVALKLALGMAKLFLLLLALVMRIVLTMAGVLVVRR